MEKYKTVVDYSLRLQVACMANSKITK